MRQISNRFISLSVDAKGRIVSLVNRATRTELITHPAASEAWQSEQDIVWEPTVVQGADIWAAASALGEVAPVWLFKPARSGCAPRL